MEQRRYTEVDLLLGKVRDKFKMGVYTTKDFSMLSEAIAACGAGYLSTSTLKRLFGYVNDRHKPTMTTLDIVAKYVGYGCYEDFYKDVLGVNTLSSAFLSDNQIWAKNLVVDDIVEIGWAPNRYIKVKFLGNSTFEVILSINSKLCKGDHFKASIFMLGEPMYLDMVWREECELGPYMAGAHGGLVTLNKI